MVLIIKRVLIIENNKLTLPKIITDIIWGLDYERKSFFGPYTQYVGYITADIIKTLLYIKRFSYYDFDEFLNINIDEINKKAKEYGIDELLCKDKNELNAVLPVLWKYLDKFDLSISSISDDTWKEVIKYLDNQKV